MSEVAPLSLDLKQRCQISILCWHLYKENCTFSYWKFLVKYLINNLSNYADLRKTTFYIIYFVLVLVFYCYHYSFRWYYLVVFFLCEAILYTVKLVTFACPPCRCKWFLFCYDKLLNYEATYTIRQVDELSAVCVSMWWRALPFLSCQLEFSSLLLKIHCLYSHIYR